MKTQSFMNVFLITILMSGPMLVSTLQLELVYASKNVNGTINSDTTWTKADSPYTLTGRVTVAYGATLTIEAGVVVNLDGNNLQINGVLNARGNTSNRITFVSQPTETGSIVFTSSSASWNEQVGVGCIIENAVVNTSMIFVVNASPKISLSSINTHVVIDGGSPLISKNTIIGDIEPEDTSSPIIDNNSITGSIYGSGFMANSPVITNNNIITERSLGISCDGFNTYIANNVISNCFDGIRIERGTAIIERNLISNNSYGITAYYGSADAIMIRNNTITNNDVGIAVYYFQPTMTLAYNNIEKNQNYSILNATPLTINATSNWWGTTNQTAINQTFSSPNIINPILNAPNQQAMPDPNGFVDPPPVLPESFPTWIIVTLLTTVTLGTALTTRKQRKNLNQQHN